MANQFRINNFNQSPPSGITRRGFLRLSLGAAAVLAIGVPAYLSHENHTAVSSVKAGLPISGVCNVMDNGTLSPQFAEKWSRELPSVIASALSPVNDKNNPGFMLNVGDASYIYRLQDDDVVSEGMGYWMKILTNASVIHQNDPTLPRSYQQKFDRLLNGVLGSLNQNGLLPWRMELIDETQSDGTIKVKDVVAVNMTDKHSATDADIYIAWALVRADALVKSGVWSAPAKGENYYADLAAQFISRIKAYDIVEKNGRSIITVSDGWGHSDVLRGAITINPSYIIPAAIEDFSRFDSGDRGYWEKVQADNLTVLGAAIGFSSSLYREIADAEGRKQKAVRLGADGATFYVFDWPHKDLLDNLLGKSGYRLTNFGITPIEDKVSNEEKKEEKKEEDREIVYYYTKGKLFIKKECLEEAIAKIDAAHAAPFVPDQIEIIVDDAGNIIPRIEFGEARLSFTEKYDGIRGPKELGEAVLSSSDPSTVCYARQLLADLNQGKHAATVRVDTDRNIIPLAVYLIGALGAGDRAMISDFEKGFDARVEESAKKAAPKKVKKTKAATPALISGIHDYEERASDKRPLPMYYRSAIATISISGAISYQIKGDKVKVVPYSQTVGRTVPDTKTGEPLPRPIKISGSDLIDAPLTYFYTLAANDGLHTDPQFPETAKKMFWDAERQLGYYPNDAEVNYNYAAALRNIGRYQEAVQHFYRTLLLAGISSNPNLVRMTLFNIENILRTLNYGEVVIGDLLLSAMETHSFDPGTRMAVMVAVMRQLNEGGHHVRALKLGKTFLARYRENRSKLGGNIWDKVTGTPLPRGRLLTEALAEIMKSISECARPATKTKDTTRIPTVEFEYTAAKRVARIVIDHSAPVGTGEIMELLEMVQAVRGDVPRELRTRLRLTEAQLNLKIMVYTHREIERVLRNPDVELSNLRLHSGRGLFEDELDQALEMGEAANRMFLEVIERELNGDQDPLLIYQALRSIIGIRTYLPKIKAMKKEYEILRRPPIKDSRLEDIPQNRQFQRDADRDFSHALLLNRLALSTIENLSLADYAGARSERSTALAMIRKIAREMNYDVDAEENVPDLLIIYRAAVRLAMANPSADPRNVLYIGGKIAQADIYLGWSEFSEFSSVQEREKRLRTGLALLTEVPRVYLSNREHAMDLSMQAVMKTMLLLYKQISLVEKKLNNADLLTGGRFDFDRNELTAKIMASPKLTQAEKETLKREVEYLFDVSRQQKDRFAALLGDPVSGSTDPMVIHFMKPENRANAFKVFGKFPTRLSDTWASWGDVTWWGRGADPATIDDAVKKYKKALEFNTTNINALRGLTQLYLFRANRTLEASVDKTTDYSMVYRTYKKALQAIQQGGVDEIILNYTLDICLQLDSDNKNEKDARIAQKLKEINGDPRLSNEDKLRGMLMVLKDY